MQRVKAFAGNKLICTVNVALSIVYIWALYHVSGLSTRDLVARCVQKDSLLIKHSIRSVFGLENLWERNEVSEN